MTTPYQRFGVALHFGARLMKQGVVEKYYPKGNISIK
jgi:hypothetical protein